MRSEPQKYKPDLYVVARIIQVLKEKQHLHKTALATCTGLSYDKLIKYLAWLSKKGFIEINKEEFVVLTKKGSEAYDDLVQWILKNIGQLKFPRLRLKT